jgi:hypothetical protein
MPKTDSPAPETSGPVGESADDSAPPKAAPTPNLEQIDPSMSELQELVAAPVENEAPRASVNSDIKAAAIEARAPQATESNETASEALLTSDADTAAPAKRAATSPPAASASADQTLAADAEPAPTNKTAQTLQVAASESVEVETRLARASSETGAQSPAPGAQTDKADDVLRITRRQDGADLSQNDPKIANMAGESDFAAPTSKSLLASATFDAKAPMSVTPLPEALLSIAQPGSVSAPAISAGLTPVAPSVPLAAPSEINSIILNALKNGAEPREQLIVQLDPPELGRVAIDFKFDAQGLQQITVTSENPEALRRLRELHFELTEALKEHGLSEQNLTFRQQADDQSNPAWQMPELIGTGDEFASVENAPGSSSIPRSNTAYSHPDRLDLTL